MDFLYGACGGGVVGVLMTLIGLLAVHHFKRLLASRDLLAEKRMAKLESTLDEHIRQDKSLAILTEIKNINGNLERMSSQVARALECNAAQTQAISNNTNYINNLREDMNTHVRIFHGGKHGK